ncbi:hypothetical protein AZ34_07760 [Hylemonella gracilis str. Niagara R]|uniref:Uncharacterized protein n=1 Tax=Hylemonella gracilis str. Niagara R TaxID=1458275 RepID=A0A016XHE6_9BURK|nr:hypothetical protein [Hylemonella gracilis]EYC50977.1 hypothetical protein AZ34_07760 [Hylemonella gracilis str. Niagara R]
MSAMTLPSPRFFSLASAPTLRSPLNTPARPAVRVVRARSNLPAHDPSCTAQRMVISGRMAEVCAELERMTAGAYR